MSSGIFSRFRHWIRPDAIKPHTSALEILKYIGPGLLVTVGFIDPGNWASNFAAGSAYGYELLWIITLSTFMLIILQHNAAHLGIATGLCLSEAATIYLPRTVSRSVLGTAMLAGISTAMAEVLGGAIALQMLFHIPIPLGSVLVLGVILWMIFSNSYRRIEKYIIGFVSVIGICMVTELAMVNIDWGIAVPHMIVPAMPDGSVIIIMSVLGAVVMPHNLFLHSEIIQSRNWHTEGDAFIRKRMKFELYDTMFSMVIGWAINSSMILIAAGVFFENKIQASEMQQAQKMLEPLLGSAAAIIFAIALLFAGIASSVTAGMAGGSIFAGIFGEPYNIRDKHSKMGVLITLIVATLIILFIGDPFRGLIISQMILSMQLPFTIFLQLSLTGSKKVMGEHANRITDSILLWAIGIFVGGLNIYLLLQFVLGNL